MNLGSLGLLGSYGLLGLMVFLVSLVLVLVGWGTCWLPWQELRKTDRSKNKKPGGIFGKKCFHHGQVGVRDVKVAMD